MQFVKCHLYLRECKITLILSKRTVKHVLDNGKKVNFCFQKKLRLFKYEVEIGFLILNESFGARHLSLDGKSTLGLFST